MRTTVCGSVCAQARQRDQPIAEAETIDVSASECTEAAAANLGKNFEGASENGEQVFFTSTQKLDQLTRSTERRTGMPPAKKGVRRFRRARGDATCTNTISDRKRSLSLVAPDEVVGSGRRSPRPVGVFIRCPERHRRRGRNEYAESAEERTAQPLRLQHR